MSKIHDKEWNKAIIKIMEFAEDALNRFDTKEQRNGSIAFKIIDAKNELGGDFKRVRDEEIFSRLCKAFDDRGYIVDEREHLDGSLIIQIFRSDSPILKDLINEQYNEYEIIAEIQELKRKNLEKEIELKNLKDKIKKLEDHIEKLRKG